MINLTPDEIESKIRYWFFKFLTDDVRMQLVKLFVPDTTHINHAQQSKVLEALLDGLDNKAKFNTLHKQHHELMQKQASYENDNIRLSESIHSKQIEIDALQSKNDLLYKCLAIILKDNDVRATCERLIESVSVSERYAQTLAGLDKATNEVGKET